MQRKDRTAVRRRRLSAVAFLAVGLLVAPIAPAAAAAATDVSIRPTTDGNTAVRFQQTIDVSGTVSGGELTAARLLGLRADGSVLGAQEVDRYTIGEPAPSPLTPVTGGGGDYLRVDGDRLSGRLTLQCLFSEPTDKCDDRQGQAGEVRRVVLEVTVGGQVTTSNPLRVDYTRPILRDGKLVDPTHVVARFTEPVRYPIVQPEAPGDWRVTLRGEDVPVLAVTGPTENDCVGGYGPGEDASAGPTGCSRTLTLGQVLDEDDNPFVEYVLFDYRLPDRAAYEDYASNRAFSVAVGPKLAVDTIRPPTPQITGVGGRTPSEGRVVGRDEAPVLTVGNLREGHDLWVELVTGEESVEGPVVTAPGSTATVGSPALPADGEHLLRVVVRDPSGNLSTETAKSTARSDGSPSQVTYVLDRVPPTLLGAAVEDGKVRVRFGEPVSGPDDPGDWRVRDAAGEARGVSSVEGTGDSRLLTVDGEPQTLARGRLDYAPSGERYADAAGNVLDDVSNVLIGGLPLPTVTVPAGPVVTKDTSVQVRGTAFPGSTVILFREGAPEQVLASGPVGADGGWSLTAPLERDTANHLRVQGVQGEDTSPVAAVPQVTQDGIAPGLSLTRPTGQEVLTSGSRSTAVWATSDANPGRVQVDISTDGATWQKLGVVAAARDGSQELAYTVPEVDTAQARIRLTSVDQAGHSTSRTSLPFRIDGISPRFSAVTTDARPTAPRQVRVQFTEPVSGPVGEWRVDGQPAILHSNDGASSPPGSVSRARVLVFETSSTFGPDDRPEVVYAPAAGGTAGELRDGSEPGHVVALDGRAVVAVDGIRPPVPSITSVGGSAPSGGRVTGPDPAPEVEAGGLQPDHVVWVERVPASGTPERGPKVTSTGSTATLSSPPLPGDGEHVLRVVAQDPTGNLSTDTTKNPGGSDGGPNPVTYVLEGVLPDTSPPKVTVLRPVAGEVLAGGSRSTVRWDHADDDPGQLVVELTTDGASFSSLGTVPAANGEGELAYTVPAVDTEVARVRVTASDRSGNSTSTLSPAFVIDATPPTFSALTTGPRTVQVIFSEPVSGTIAPGDFRVDAQPATVSTEQSGVTPASAEGTRALVLTAPADFGEDGTPTITYAPSPAGELVDRAGQGIERRVVSALDGIRPAVPTITAVDGRAPSDGRVLGGSVTPQVSVRNLTAGHTVRVERVPASGAPVAGPDVQAQGGTALVSAPRLPDDGEHVLRAVVRDPSGNTSLDSAKNAGRADGGPDTVTYVLDSRLPAILFAVADNDDITVRFSEPVLPDDGSAADWRVTRTDGTVVPPGQGGVVGPVRGSGDTRVLYAPGATPGDLLVYAPQGQRYTDVSANPVPDTTTPLLALAPPVVTTPARAVFVTTDSTVVAGLAQPGSTVSLFHRGRDGAPAGAAVADAAVGSDGRWSLVAPLEADRAHDFLVRSRRTDGRDSVAVPVPTITQDSAAPVLSVRGLPREQQVIAPGAPHTFLWSACDANLGATPMTFEYSLDDGDRWTRFGQERHPSANDCGTEGSKQVTLPGHEETQAARLRVSATDLAGHTTSVVSPRFVLEGTTQVRSLETFACPPGKVAPAGFTDTADSTFRFEIDCLAAYGFTKGVSSDRYAPADNVSRAQMALFIARLAAYGDVPLDTRDAGFNDMDRTPQETRDAVNALANLGVVKGVGGGRYDPAGQVSRAQMASFLARLQRSVGAPFPAARDSFDDDQGNVHEASINAIAGAGVVQGTAPGRYEPLALVTRQQMAGFLMRYVDGRIEAGEMRSAY